MCKTVSLWWTAQETGLSITALGPRISDNLKHPFHIFIHLVVAVLAQNEVPLVALYQKPDGVGLAAIHVPSCMRGSQKYVLLFIPSTTS